MILQFKEELVNTFFKNIFSSPSLLWKAIASLLFVSIGIGIIINFGFKDGSLAALAGLLFVYGISRFIAFYNEYKRTYDE